jgi:hypothetical protein
MGHHPRPGARFPRCPRGAGDRRCRLKQHPRRLGVHDAHRARTEVGGKRPGMADRPAGSRPRPAQSARAVGLGDRIGALVAAAGRT